MNVLVKYSCGCVGFTPDANGKATIIATCDSMGEPHATLDRDVSDKQSVLMTEDETRKWHQEIVQSFWQAETYRQLRTLIRGMT